MFEGGTWHNQGRIPKSWWESQCVGFRRHHPKFYDIRVINIKFYCHCFKILKKGRIAWFRVINSPNNVHFLAQLLQQMQKQMQTKGVSNIGHWQKQQHVRIHGWNCWSGNHQIKNDNEDGGGREMSWPGSVTNRWAMSGREHKLPPICKRNWREQEGA